MSQQKNQSNPRLWRYMKQLQPTIIKNSNNKENQIENGGNTPKKTFEECITHTCDTLLTRIEKTQKANCDLVELSDAIRKVKAIASKKVDVSF